MIVISLGKGAYAIAPRDVVDILLYKLGLSSGEGIQPMDESILWIIRLPRVLLAILVGAALSAAGVCMQGLFRNPLADPQLIGITAGASLAAALVLVYGSLMIMGAATLPVAAFLGCFIAAALVYQLSRSGGKAITSIMLLAGIAINALSMSFVGYLTFAADDDELRDLTFWTLGSLGGASWENLAMVAPFILIPLFIMPFFGKSLNAYALGEDGASMLGINTGRFKIIIILLTTLVVGASVAVTGVIGFLGLVVPHIVRMIVGPEHKNLIVSSILLGALLLLTADLFSRTLIAPVEIPIGIITAILGTPLFLSILIREKRKTSLPA